MALYIDPPMWPAHGRLWSHLISDVSLAELHAFAAAQGIPRRGFERDHYDVPAEAHDTLVEAGATPVSSREVLARLRASGLRRRKSTAMSRKAPGRDLLRPPRLRVGDVVAVVAASGAVPPDALAAGMERLEAWGLRPRLQPGVLARLDGLGYLAGSDEQRTADFEEAWFDPSVRAIMAARGGFGAQRTAELVDWRRLAEAEPKAVIGFSDVTALHQAVASRLGIGSVHGHVVTSLGAATAESAEGLRRLLLEPDGVGDLLEGQRPRVLVPGTADGVLVGGNLAVLSTDVGTSTSRPAHGGIVIVEDIGEEPYRIDRALTHLVRAGWFAGVRGVVVGAFTDCGDPDVVDEVVRRRIGALGVPAVMGVDVGHTRSTLSIPLGARATLDAAAGTLTLAGPPLA